jgi:gamma-glutamyltranspeptidase/glutathione hydrolase
MASTSSPQATRAALRVLERGGTAADAAVAAAAILCVTEPMNTGIGGDCFALVAHDGTCVGLDSAGPAPLSAFPTTPVEQRGARSITVPGAVAGWAALSERFGRLGLDSCLGDAIDAAERGVAVSNRAAALWLSEGPCPDGVGPAIARVGDVVRMPEMGRTLRLIAEQGPRAVYAGRVAEAITSVSWLAEEDLSGFHSSWVTPLSAPYREHTIFEMPPPTQGVTALEALLLLEGLEPSLANSLANQIRCVKLALEDATTHVRDGADVGFLIAPEFLRARRTQVARAVRSVDAGTSHLCVVDSDRMAVSFIESLFQGFGSKVVAPGTGVVLQNRGSCFSVSGQVLPGKRPYHTIIPGMMARGDEFLAAFGVVGGHMQAQAHVQLVSSIVDDGLDPQQALDRPRFRVDGSTVRLEEGLWPAATKLESLGFQTVCSPGWTEFGCGQIAAKDGNVLVGASDPRMDGYAAGL